MTIISHNDKLFLVTAAISVAILCLGIQAFTVPWVKSSTLGQETDTGLGIYLTELCRPDTTGEWQCQTWSDLVNAAKDDNDRDCKTFQCKQYTRLMHSGVAIVFMGVCSMVCTLTGIILCLLAWKRQFKKKWLFITYMAACFFSNVCLVVYKAAYSFDGEASIGVTLCSIVVMAQALCCYLTYTGLKYMIPKKLHASFVTGIVSALFAVASLFLAWEGSPTKSSTQIDNGGQQCGESDDFFLYERCVIYSECNVDYQCTSFSDLECGNSDPCSKMISSGQAAVALGALAVVCSLVALVLTGLAALCNKRVGPRLLPMAVMGLALSFHFLQFQVWLGAFSQSLVEQNFNLALKGGPILSFFLAVPFQVFSVMLFHHASADTPRPIKTSNQSVEVVRSKPNKSDQAQKPQDLQAIREEK